ncbi:hypothetical protein CEE35_09090 [Candidatus Aerophobetes bacterium Ae_b3b]|nr:MAG: hypothetical protein CEE35_09090 [Candidatus Aerophobetes bacterium Ae_b3b]
MAKVFMDRKWIIAKGGVLMFVGRFLWWGGVICFVLGIISTIINLALNITLALEPISWFLLAIAFFVASIPNFIGWALAVHLDAIEAKSKKEE